MGHDSWESTASSTPRVDDNGERAITIRIAIAVEGELCHPHWVIVPVHEEDECGVLPDDRLNVLELQSFTLQQLDVERSPQTGASTKPTADLVADRVLWANQTRPAGYDLMIPRVFLGFLRCLPGERILEKDGAVRRSSQVCVAAPQELPLRAARQPTARDLARRPQDARAVGRTLGCD